MTTMIMIICQCRYYKKLHAKHIHMHAAEEIIFVKLTQCMV